jgi:hypothetical protein
MTETKQCSLGIIAVKVNENDWCFHVEDRFLRAFHKEGERMPVGDGIATIGWHCFLPPGDWTMLLDTSKVSEEDAKRVVESGVLMGGHTVFTNYMQEHDRIAYYLTALESFATYLVHYGINEGRHILLFNKNHKS